MARSAGNIPLGEAIGYSLDNLVNDLLSLNFSPPKGYEHVQEQFKELGDLFTSLLMTDSKSVDQAELDEAQLLASRMDVWMQLPSGRENRVSFRNLLSDYTDVVTAKEGGFAFVYKAKRSDGTVVALKIPKPDVEYAFESFKAEMNAWNDLRRIGEDVNIVRVFEPVLGPGKYQAIEMEWLDGGTLAEWDKPQPVQQVALVIWGVAHALQAAHIKGLFHNDIRPSNILFASRGDALAKLADWGLSSVLTPSGTVGHTDEFFERRLINTGYAAPELLDRDYGAPGAKTDVFQLALVMYELVTGLDINMIRRSRQSALAFKPEPVSKFGPKAKLLDDLLPKALAMQVSERSSLDEFGRGISDILGAEWVSSMSVTPTRESRVAYAKLALKDLDSNDGSALLTELEWLVDNVTDTECARGFRDAIEIVTEYIRADNADVPLSDLRNKLSPALYRIISINSSDLRGR